MTRLIDADKLYPDRMTKDGLAISQSQIANAPTVEERPKGKWIDNGSAGYYGTREWYCSSCKFRWIACRRESLDPDWCFCPTCGAEMEVADNDKN